MENFVIFSGEFEKITCRHTALSASLRYAKWGNCGARPREEERDNREMMELSGKWRHRAMKTSCTNLEQQLPEPVLV